jgi:integrase
LHSKRFGRFDVTNSVTKRCVMAGKIRHFMERDGRYFARVVIPKDLRPFLAGKTELREPLGADRRVALRKHLGALADLMQKIATAEHLRDVAHGTVAVPRLHQLTNEQMAGRLYNMRLEMDEIGRNDVPGYASIGVNDQYVIALRDGIVGKLSDGGLKALVGQHIDDFRHRGNTLSEPFTSEWRSLARELCKAELQALERMVERDEGDHSGVPSLPYPQIDLTIAEQISPISITGLFDDYIASRLRLGGGKGAEKRWEPVFPHLVSHLGHDDARKITKKDLIEWRNTLQERLAPSTINKVYLTAVKTVLNWAVSEDRLEQNPAREIRQEIPKKVQSREQGYTKDEATTILRFCFRYEPKPYLGDKVRELAETSAAKKWIPLLLAYTGARVAELTQLRKMDITKDGEIYVMRITPEAGTVKTGSYRDVPIHPALVEAGFMDFVSAAKSGPLFISHDGKGTDLKRAQTVGNRIAEWLKDAGLVPPGVSPNHGWRHRFKTLAREEGQSDRIVDAICGHAGRTAGDTYGDVTVKAKYNVIAAMPPYELNQPTSMQDPVKS